MKRGIYQQQVGNKEVKVANTMRSLKMRLKSPKCPSRHDEMFQNGINISLLDGKTFKLYTSKNQKGIVFTVETDKVLKNTKGYYSKMANKRIGSGGTVTRARIIMGK